MSFLEELKRRNVIRVGIAYVLLATAVRDEPAAASRPALPGEGLVTESLLAEFWFSPRRSCGGKVRRALRRDAPWARWSQEFVQTNA